MNLDAIETLISSKKAAAYKLKYSNNWFKAYKAEIAQVKEAFVYLHFLEIFLRNRIFTEFEKDFDNWLLEDRVRLQLNLKEREKISKIMLELNRSGKKIDSDNVVSNLNFGFWTSLFHKSYNYSIWQQNKMIERVFPYFKGYERNLKSIQREMELIRKFRNRIFHYETVQDWNIKELQELMAKFVYGIGGIKVVDLAD